MSPASFLLHTPWQMNGTLCRRMHAAEDKLWGLPQAGRRLERYVEDLIELIELILFHPAPRSSTYRTNGSDCLPNSKRPLILRSSASHGSRHPWLIQAHRSWRNPGRRLRWSQGRRPQLSQARRRSPVQTQALRLHSESKPTNHQGNPGRHPCAPGSTGVIWGYELEPSSRTRSSQAPSWARCLSAPSSARSSQVCSSARSSQVCSSARSSQVCSSARSSQVCSSARVSSARASWAPLCARSSQAPPRLYRLPQENCFGGAMSIHGHSGWAKGQGDPWTIMAARALCFAPWGLPCLHPGLASRPL